MGERFYPEETTIADILRRLDALERSRTGGFSADGETTYLRGARNLVIDGGKLQVIDGSGNVLGEFDAAGLDIFESDGSVLVAITGTGIRLNDGSGTKLIDLTTAGLKAYESDGSTILELDGSKLRFNRSDGTRSLEITPGGGLKIYDTDGTTEKVVLSAAGLTVDGGDNVATYTDVKANGGSVTLTDTTTEHASANFTLPSWVATAKVFATCYTQSSNNTGTGFDIVARCRVNDVAAGSAQVSVLDDRRAQAVHHATSTIDTSVSGFTVQISAYGDHTGVSPGHDHPANAAVWGMIVGYAT